MKIFGGIILFFVFIFGMSWLVQGNEFFLYKYWAPKQAAVERDVFTNTPSYVQGTIQEIENMRFQYVQADDAHKAALASIILRRVEAFDATASKDYFSSDLRGFVNELKHPRSTFPPSK